MNRVRARLAALAVSLAVTGCGVPTDDNARRIADDDVPFALLDPAPATTTSSSTTSTSTTPPA